MVAGLQYFVGRTQAKAGVESYRLLQHEPLDHLYISIVNIAETRFGIELQEEPAGRPELKEGLTVKLRPAFARRILPITEDFLLTWRVLLEDGRKSGHTYSHPDLLLAATALQHGLTVGTRAGPILTKHGCPWSTLGSDKLRVLRKLKCRDSLPYSLIASEPVLS